MQGIQGGIERINKTLDEALGSDGAAGGGQDAESMDRLADAVASLVQQMREEQKIVRQWAQAQQTQQSELQRLLLKATRQNERSGGRLGQRATIEDEE
jgi:hypothetical protein